MTVPNVRSDEHCDLKGFPDGQPLVWYLVILELKYNHIFAFFIDKEKLAVSFINAFLKTVFHNFSYCMWSRMSCAVLK